MMDFFKGYWQFLFLALGLIVLAGVIMNWKWLCGPKETEDQQKMFDRGVKRFKLVVLGVTLMAIGVVGLII